MWGRALVVALVMLGMAGAATAGNKTRKVAITSDPIGATVYFDSEDTEPQGETPFVADLPAGTYLMIFKKDEFDAEFKEVPVAPPTRRNKKKQDVSVTLRKSMALVKIIGAPAGATVQIDGGSKLPVAESLDGEFDITAGDHRVVVLLGDKVLLEEYIAVASNDEKEITVHGRIATGVGGGDDPDDGTTTVVTTVAPSRNRGGPVFTVAPLVDLTWRDFEYSEDSTLASNLPATHVGVMFGGQVELNPLRLTNIRVLHPLAIVVAAAFAIPVRVSPPDGMPTFNAETFSQRYLAGLRYRLALGKVDLDLEAGYSRFLYRFGGSEIDVDILPDVDYQTIRFGGRLGVRLAHDGVDIVPFVGGENRVVLSSGVLATRYDRADIQGYAFRAGVDLGLWGGKIAARLEAAYGRFEWSFEPMSGSRYDATSGLDQQLGTTLTVGYAY
jgi:hypothetical protein